ncbi:NADH-quinone oxidoreductase subunit NuoG [Burkholderia pseudomallei]|nr:NADH-quinone oxidoreductase subunit NuoG [Burkholderia pseudomallei]
MVELEIDGKKVEVPEGSMVIQAAHKADTYIPHFCYHKKLSVAANCRMCLVEVEKMPKAVPACATPVSAGMIVHTNSEKAVKAQQSVMEFLLINHPLDCPICDQGGECQLQDLAVGYGKSTSRYAEEKRVVFHKEVGPLISMEEMSRCIHCTRCVRFGQEIAGVMEFGMLGRGEHSEITTFVGKTVDSELSGNMIDLCPVGALTSKPFRYSARTWELSRRKSVSPHDSVGANLVVQVKNNRVMRVLPFENEAVNECWISDKDRFSYEGLNSEERLTKPMIKQGGEWREVDWQTALEYVARGLKGIGDEHGPAAIAALGSAHSTVEELFLLKQLAHELKTPNVDFRLRQTDFSAAAQGAPWLGMPIADLSAVDAAFVVGSFLRRDHPLFAARLRQAAKNGAKLHFLHATGDDALIPTAQRIVAAPSAWLDTLAGVAAAAATGTLTGAVTVGWRIPSFIVSLGVLEAARGVAYQLTNSRTAYIGDAFDFLSNPIALGISPAFLIAVAVMIVAQFVLARTVFGRYLVGIGTNEEAVRLAGVNPRPYKIIVFALMGALAGLAALFQISRLEAADPNAGAGLELQVIAAVVIGGTSLMGGRGSVVSTFFGVSIISVLAAGLAQIGANEPTKRIITGAVIVVAVVLDTYRSRRARG